MRQTRQTRMERLRLEQQRQDLAIRRAAYVDDLLEFLKERNLTEDFIDWLLRRRYPEPGTTETPSTPSST